VRSGNAGALGLHQAKLLGLSATHAGVGIECALSLPREAGA
jgi:hypothetical protein